MWRCIPPVVSPVSARAVINGVSAALGGEPDARICVRSFLRARLAATDVVLTDSGTSALILALRTSVQKEGIIALPGYGCVDLAAAAIGAGLRVRLYDLDPRTLSPDLDSLRRALDRGANAVVVAHLFGYPADVAGVVKLAGEFGAAVIEDAAQGAGGRLHSARIGSLADISVLSFGRGKGTTGGRGGAMVVRTKSLARRTEIIGETLSTSQRGAAQALAVAAQGILSNPFLYRVPASIPALKLGEMIYRPPSPPGKMSSVSAAILTETLHLEDLELSRRQLHARELLSSIGGNRTLTVVRPVCGGESGYLRFAVLDDTGSRRASRTLGITRPYPLTLEQHHELQPSIMSGEHAGKGAEILRDRLYTLPTHSKVGVADVARLVRWAHAEALPQRALAAVV
ncbi:MAG TPA: DegT/DnrJ/EryC1/StrS family aminotransferase [Gemmatimonadaceae bacterium]|jgi:dTDP-4-amino-4,6-dideoxygalactose transaminase